MSQHSVKTAGGNFTHLNLSLGSLGRGSSNVAASGPLDLLERAMHPRAGHVPLRHRDGPGEDVVRRAPNEESNWCFVLTEL